MIGKTIEELQVGDTARFSKTISESDVYLFAGLTGDLNPAHVNEDYAKNTFFKTRIAHGMLTASLISAVIGTMLPGPGTMYMGQEVRFLAPVKFGDTVTAIVEVAEIIADKKRFDSKPTASIRKIRPWWTEKPWSVHRANLRIDHFKLFFGAQVYVAGLI